MKKVEWLLLSSSAILYALAFLFVEYCWLLIFVFSIPLLYLVCIKNLSFIHGFMWSLGTFFLQSIGGIYVIASMAQDAWLVGIGISILVILYQSFVIGLFFWCAGRITTFFSLQSVPLLLLMWAVIFMCIITWIDRYSLLIFGRVEGYPLMHPLIPLAQYPQFLLLLPTLGKILLTFLLFLSSASVVLFLWYKNKFALLSMIFAFMPWIGCWFYDTGKIQKPDWLAQVCTISYMAYSTVHYPYAMVKSVGKELKKVIKQYPEVVMVVMPESALNCMTLFDNCELIQLWSKQHIGKKLHYIFGTFRCIDNNYYNTICWIDNGFLQKYFNKRHAVLISERLAPIINWNWLRYIYFKEQRETVIATNARERFMISDTQMYVPYICSELFFNEYPDDCYNDVTIMALINDSSFMSPYALYICKLLLLLARYKAIQWQRSILYISYTQSVFIDKNGRMFFVNRF